MATAYKVLAQFRAYYQPNAGLTVYTVPTGKQVVISKLIFNLGDASSGTRMHIVKSGQSAGTSNIVAYNSASTGFFKGITMSAGDFIYIQIGNVNTETLVQIFGAEIDA